MSNESNEIYEVAARVAATNPVHHGPSTDTKNPSSLNVSHFPLKSAFLCGNCDNVTNCMTACPACGSSEGLVSLAAIVNREYPDVS